MKKIYFLKSDVTHFCSFIQSIGEQESIMGLAMRQRWVPFGDKYDKVILEIRSNDYGKKNYGFDFSGALNPFFVISDKCFDSIGNILMPRGELLPVITKSKRKKFFGYYPTNALSGCFDKNNSEYREYPKGLMIEKIVLMKDKISEDYIFSIEEDVSRVFVTEKFKALVEKCDLQGFDFSREVELS